MLGPDSQKMDEQQRLLALISRHTGVLSEDPWRTRITVS